MTSLNIIIWGLGCCLLLLIITMCYIGIAMPFGEATKVKLYSLEVIQCLMIPSAGILALFAVALKELIGSDKEK